jgi:hypothetical protein
LLVGRLDVVETVGVVIEEVAGGSGVRPAARRVDVPYTTARGWWRRFGEGAERLGLAFAALAVELGGVAVRPVRRLEGWTLAAMAAAWQAGAGLPGWGVLGSWRFFSAVTGGRLIATNRERRTASWTTTWPNKWPCTVGRSSAKPAATG